MPGEETTTSDAIARAAVAAGPSLLTWAYRRIFRIPSYTADDKSRYDKLVRYYNAMHTDATLPAHWVLEDRGGGKYAPTYEYAFAEEGPRIMGQFDSLGMSPANARLSARAILSTIIKLFDSLAKRSIHTLRRGSVEGMFFVELAEWVMETLPTLRFDNEADLLQLKKRRAYCESILEQVLVPDTGLRAGERNHPMPALAEIIINLDSLIDCTKDVIYSMTFNDYGKRLNDHLLYMISDSLQILRYMVDGDHDAEMELPIALFLSDTTTHRHSISDIKKKRLGIWIVHTLNAAGVLDNSLVDTKAMRLEEAAFHLDGEWVGDTTSRLPPALSDPKHADWGHWKFVRDSTLDVAELSRNIRTIHRSMLNLFILRRAIFNLLKAAPVYGEAWLYKDEVGISMLKDLMAVTDRLALELSQSLDAVYRPLMELYDVRERAGAIRVYGHCYQAMRSMKAIYRSFEANRANLSEAIEAIKAAAGQVDQRIAEADESKYAVLKFLVNFMERSYGEGASSAPGLHYPLLRRALTDFSSTVIEPDAAAAPLAHGGAGRERTPGTLFLEEARQEAAHSRYAAVIRRIRGASAPSVPLSEDDAPRSEVDFTRRTDMPNPIHTTAPGLVPGAPRAPAMPGTTPTATTTDVPPRAPLTPVSPPVSSSALTAKEAAALKAIEEEIASCRIDVGKIKRNETVCLAVLSIGELKLPSGLSREIYHRVVIEYKKVGESSFSRFFAGYFGKDAKLVQRYLSGFMSILDSIAANYNPRSPQGGLSEAFVGDTDRYLNLLLIEMVKDLPYMRKAVIVASESSMDMITALYVKNETLKATSDVKIETLERALAEERTARARDLAEERAARERELAEERATRERERAGDRAAFEAELASLRARLDGTTTVQTAAPATVPPATGVASAAAAATPATAPSPVGGAIAAGLLRMGLLRPAGGATPAAGAGAGASAAAPAVAGAGVGGSVRQ